VDEAERNPEVAFQTNFVGAENVAMAARMVGARLLYVSTESVFNGTSSCPVTENDDCDPPSQYARSKRAGEMAVLGIAENNWIIRTSWLYSRSGTANFPHRLIERLQRTNGPVPVVTDLWGQPTPAELFARWLLRFVAAQPAGGIYHAACSGIVSKHDWAVAIARQCGFKTERITKVLQSSFEDLAPRPTRVELDCSRFMQVTNSTLESWDEAFTTFGCQNT
jgi:dTDP-4-dehydrorhamnose reductase